MLFGNRLSPAVVLKRLKLWKHPWNPICKERRFNVMEQSQTEKGVMRSSTPFVTGDGHRLRSLLSDGLHPKTIWRTAPVKWNALSVPWNILHPDGNDGG